MDFTKQECVEAMNFGRRHGIESVLTMLDQIASLRGNAPLSLLLPIIRDSLKETGFINDITKEQIESEMKYIMASRSSSI